MSHREKKFIDIAFNFFNNLTSKRLMLIKNNAKLSSIIHNKSNQAYVYLKDNYSRIVDINKSKNVLYAQKSDSAKGSEIDKKLDKEETKTPQGANLKKNYYGLDIPKLLGELKVNVTSMKQSPRKVPKWKTNPPKVTKEGVNYRTSHLLESLKSVEYSSSRLKRLEEFLQHLIQHPEAQNFAVKTGAINTLLEVRVRTGDDPPSHEAIRTVLSALGYSNPPGSNGIRILSIDGGGMRGIAVIRMLQKIEEISGKKIYDLFDFICGVSTGAIITCGLVPPNRMPMSRIYDLYRELSSKVFKQSPFWGTSKLVWSHAYYDTSLWEKFLKDHVGCLNLIETNKDSSCPRIAVVSTIVNHSKVAPFIFRNYGNPCLRSSEYQGSYRHTMFEAVRASAAAPTIFEEFKTGHMLHQDGGIVVNNPAAIALHEARCLWPDEAINCIVSIGTGKYDPMSSMEDLEVSAKYSTSWKQIFEKILESATDTEAVHRILNDLLPNNTYFRLNPHLSRVVTMDETSDEKLLALEEDTEMYCRRNEDKFHEIAAKLTKPRTVTKILKDAVVMQMRLSGVIV